MTMTLDRTSRAGPASDPLAPTPETTEPVLLHRRRGALLLVGVAAAAVALAYLWRGLAAGGGVLAYAVAAALLPVALVHLAAWWDARIPLLMADGTGLRLRQGRQWIGLRWDEVQGVRLSPARFPRRDASLHVGRAAGRGRVLPLAMVDPTDVRALPEALRGLAPATVEVGVTGTDDAESDHAESDHAESDHTDRAGTDNPETDQAEAAPTETPSAAQPPDHPAVQPLHSGADRTAPDQAQVLVTPPRGGHAAPAATPRRRWWGGGRGAEPAATGSGDAAGVDEQLAQLLRPETRGDARPRVARADVTMRGSAGTVSSRLPPVDDQSHPPAPVELEDPGDAAAPHPAAMPEPDEHPAPEPVPDPVIGRQVVAARRSLRLSVDELAERTRIRPHVIEAIEVDDFSACGGDVYARGHLRVLARVLGIDADALLVPYDERYAAAPVTARSVLEAELANSGRPVATASGPRWSVLIGAVLVLALVWAAAQLLVPAADVDAGDAARDAGAAAQRSGEGNGGATDPAEKAAERFSSMGQTTSPARLRLAGAPDAPTSTTVTVTGRDGTVLFQGAIGPGDVERIPVTGKTTIVAGDGGLVLVQVDGRRVGRLGPAGEPARRTVGG